MDDNVMTHEQLEKLDKNPHYKLNQKQQALLAQYRAGKFKNNPNFVKHPTGLETNASEHTDERKATNND